MANAGAVKAGDAFVQVSVEGLEDIKAELDNLKSEIAKGFDKSTRLQAISAIADGFRMVSGAVQTAGRMVAWFAGNIRQAIERVSELQKIADRLGTSITFISRIKVAAVVSNMSMNELEQAFAAFQRNMETFSQGVGESKATFEGLGITPEMLLGWGTLENQMVNIIGRLAQIEDPSKRAGAAMRIFGEQGRKLIPLVNANVESFQALLEMSDFLGLTLDEDAGRSLDATRDNFRLLYEQINAVWNKLAADLGPELQHFTTELIVAFKTIVDLVTANEDLSSSFQWIGDSVKSVASAFMFLRSWMLKIQAGFLDIAELYTQYDTIFRGIALLADNLFGSDLFASSGKIAEMQKGIKASIAEVDIARDKFSETFDQNRAAWKDLFERSRPASEALKKGAEDMKDAAVILSETFSGEVIGRAADDMRRAQEISSRTFQNMERSLNSINNHMRNAPVVRGFLS